MKWYIFVFASAIEVIKKLLFTILKCYLCLCKLE